MAETQAEMIRRLREQTWDEGYKACQTGKHSGNPYKKKEK